MALRVEYPALPRAYSTQDPYVLAGFDIDLVRSLEIYLRKIVDRANDAVQVGEAITAPAITTPAITTDSLTLNGMAAGFLATNSDDLVVPRTLTGTANQIAVSNGTGLSGDPVFSLSAGVLATGTYTPTFTGVTNVAAAVGSYGRWFRIGNRVFVEARGTVDPTAAAPTTTTFRCSLPVASNLGVSTDLGGIGMSNGGTNVYGTIQADTTNDDATITFSAGNANNATHWLIFSYEVI